LPGIGDNSWLSGPHPAAGLRGAAVLPPCHGARQTALARDPQIGWRRSPPPDTPFKDHPIPNLVYLGLVLHDAAMAP